MIRRILAAAGLALVAGWLALAAAPALAGQGNTVLPTTGTFTGLQEQEYLNAALDAVLSGSIGGTAPANGTGGGAVQGQTWWDTSVAGYMTLKYYDGGSWFVVGTENTSTHVFAIPNAALANSSVTIAGHVVALGGSQALAAADLLNGTTGSGAVALAASPAFSGTPTAPTPATTDNSNTIATTAFVKAAAGSGGIPAATHLVVNSNQAGGTSTQVSADYAFLLNGSGVGIGVSGVSLTLSSGTSGAGGVDTGSIAANTWYYVWLISNGSTTSGLYSLSSTSPTMPSGYNYKMRIGAVLTNASSQFFPTYQRGRRVQYVVGGVGLSAMRLAVTSPPGGWRSVDLSDFVPATASRVQGASQGYGSHIFMAAPNGSYGLVNFPAGAALVDGSTTGDLTAYYFDFVLETAQQMYFYGSSSGGVALAILGWTDSVNAS